MSLFEEGESVFESREESLSNLQIIPWLIAEDETKW